MDWQRLDVQMRRFAPRLITEIGLGSGDTGKLATTIAADVRFLPPEELDLSERFRRDNLLGAEGQRT